MDWQTRDPISLLRKRIECEMPILSPKIAEIEQQVFSRMDTVFKVSKGRFEVANAQMELPVPKPPDPSKV